jgi:biotin operon repressor
MADEQFFQVLNAVLAVRSMPDGSRCPHGLKHTLLVLATHYPNIYPGQARLAVELGITRANVNKRLAALEDAGLIARLRRGEFPQQLTTLYRLKVAMVHKCAAGPVSAAAPISPPIHKRQDNSNGTPSEGADAWGEFPF